MMAQKCGFALCLAIAATAAFTIPTVTLKNAARVHLCLALYGELL
jgi:hypothetical protein